MSISISLFENFSSVFVIFDAVGAESRSSLLMEALWKIFLSSLSIFWVPVPPN